MGEAAAGVPEPTSFVRRAASRLRALLKRRLAIDIGALTVGHYIAALLGLATAALGARVLGARGYGISAVVMAYPLILRSFLEVKSTSVTTRYISSFHDQGKKSELAAVCKLGFAIDTGVATACLAIVAATSTWVASAFFDFNGFAWLAIAYTFSFPFASLTGTSRAVLTSLHEFRWLAGFHMFERGLTLALVGAFLLADGGVTGFVLATALAQALTGVATVFVCNRFLRKEGVPRWSRASLSTIGPVRREIVGSLGWNYLLVTFAGILDRAPILLLGHLQGPASAGYFRLASSLVVAMSYVEDSLRRVAYPRLAVRWNGDKRHEVAAAVKRWTLRAGAPVGAALLLTIPFLPFVVRTVFGEEFSPISRGLQIMVAGLAVSVLFFWREPFYFATGKLKSITIVHAVYAAAAIAVGYWVADRYGFTGLVALLTGGRVLTTLYLSAAAWRASRRASVAGGPA